MMVVVNEFRSISRLILTLATAMVGGCLPQTGGDVSHLGENSNCVPRPTLKSFPPAIVDLPRLPYLNVNFPDPAERAPLIEDGLEFREAHGAWAVYEVTSATPRLWFHGIDADPNGYGHPVGICNGNAQFGEFPAGSPVITSLLVKGTPEGQTEPVVLGEDLWFSFDWGGCSSPGDRLQGYPGEAIDNIFIEVDPAPPLGTYIALRMLIVGRSTEPSPHNDNVERVCCVDGLCDLNFPPEPPEGNDPPDGNEPPDGNDPPGGTEPPDGSTSPGDSEPPSVSVPYCDELPPEEQRPMGEPAGVSNPTVS